jgi:hypothetical protein
MSENPHPQVASMVASYRRDLARCVPSHELDARIDQLVATPGENISRAAIRPTRARSPGSMQWVARFAAAAVLAALAVATGVFIGVRVERAGSPPAAAAHTGEPAWPPPEFSMWPTDSVALKVAADNAGSRYWVDIVISNDGTVRIENIVPAGGEQHGITTQTP